MPIRLPVVLSPSRTELSARCYRRHVLADVVDRQPADGAFRPSADFGTVMHQGVAEWWRATIAGEPGPVAFDRAEAVLRGSWNELRPWGDRHSLEMAGALLGHYAAKMPLAGPLAGRWHVLERNGEPMIEQRLEVQLDGAMLSFQIDRLLENDRGELALIDLKTSARLSPRWHGQFDRWLQGKLYEAGVLQTLGRKLDHLIVEGLEKSVPVKHEYHSCPYWDEEMIREAVELFAHYARLDRELLEAALQQLNCPMDSEDFERRWRAAVEEMAVCAVPYNYFDCDAYNQPCAYAPLCQRPASQRWGLLQSDYVVAPVEGY